MLIRKIIFLLCTFVAAFSEEIPFFTIQDATLCVSKKAIYSNKQKSRSYFPVFSKKPPRKLKKTKHLQYTLNPLFKTKYVDGELLLIVDDNVGMVSHYFHFMEHLIGIWNFSTYKNPEKVKMILFAFKSVSNKDHNWKGLANNTTKILLTSLFPNAKIGLLHELPEKLNLKAKKIHISSRVRSHGIPEAGHNNMNGSAKTLYHPERLKKMRDRIFTKLNIKKERKKDLFRITYCKRYVGRSLDSVVEEELLSRISREEGVFLQVVDFANLSFKEQIQIIANTDLLMGVHGNGFTHLHFLPDDATLLEFMQGGESAFFRLFAQVRGLRYFANIQDRWITEEYTSLANIGPFQEAVTNIDLEGTINLIKRLKVKDEPVR